MAERAELSASSNRSPWDGSGSPADADRPFLIVGNTPVARRVCAALRSRYGTARVIHVVSPSDRDLARALVNGLDYAAVLVREDVAALRYALALAHLEPRLPLTVTVFDRTIADRLQDLLPHADVVSSASVAVPALVGPCLDSGILAAFTDSDDCVEVRLTEETFVERRVEIRQGVSVGRLVRALRIDHRHQDRGTQLLLKGLLGLALVLAADWTWLVLIRGHAPTPALSEAARVLATVGPGPAHVDGAYGVASAAAMLLTIMLTALFTAGLVERLLEPRLVRLSGSGAVPRSRHVIVVGLGQVGFRLCEELQAKGHPVVAVERDRHAPGVQLARQARIPVIIGDGTSRHLLEQLDADRCLAIAAVGSSDLDNVAVAVTASAVSPSTRVVMRAGEQEAVSETRSLLPLGVTRDVTAIGAAWIVARLVYANPDMQIVSHDDEIHVRTGPRTYAVLPMPRGDDCSHVGASSVPQAARATAAKSF